MGQALVNMALPPCSNDGENAACWYTLRGNLHVSGHDGGDVNEVVGRWIS